MNFTTTIIDWYLRHKRDLPWRETLDPYRIWLSEIILQQTRVDQGMAYYHKFVKNYPSIQHLAQAAENQILKDWQGLGYYSRARNLHFAAKYVVNQLDGEFPKSYDQIIKLKGVGEYTAAAIASFAFNEVKPVVDGNVMRVISRFFGVVEAIDSAEGKKNIKRLAEDFISNEDPATFNQAIMEFGALQCVPKNPKCGICPLQSGCIAYKDELVSELPWKEKKVKVLPVYQHYFIVETADGVWMRKRENLGIWEGLFDFPSVEFDKVKSPTEVFEKAKTDVLPNLDFELVGESDEIKHILSHRRLFARFYHIKLLNKQHKMPAYLQAIDRDQIVEVGIPRLIEKYLIKIGWYE